METLELRNQGVEGSVRLRWMLVWLGFGVSLGLLGGNLLVEGPRGGSFLPAWEVLAVGIPILAIPLLIIGWLGARTLVVSFVPKTITLSRVGILGDFRRAGWPGPPVLEMRFQNVKKLRHEPLIRLPQVVADRDREIVNRLESPTVFYLTEENFSIVRRAYQSWLLESAPRE